MIAVIWPIKLYLCFLLLEYLFPYIDVFSVTFLFNDLNFYKAEVLPLLLISIASILLIDWRLAVAPLLAVCQQLQSIERLGNQVVTKVDRSSKRTTSNQPHRRFGESIGEIFTFYYVEISKYWLRIMMVCVFYIILKAFNCSDFFTVVVSHAILCLTINLTLSK